MADYAASRVKTTTVTAGTGNITCGSAAAGFDGISSAVPVGGRFKYGIVGPSDREEGLATLVSTSPDVFSRDVVAKSSNSNAKVNFTSGPTRDVFITYIPEFDYPPMPRGHIAGLTLSNNAGNASNGIDIAAGGARSDDDLFSIELKSALTNKQLNAAWAAGSSAGMLDTGAKANSTWYHLFLIKRFDTGAVDVLASTSASSPTMPSGYVAKRRIGAIKTDGSGNILAFSQNGDDFLWGTDILDFSTATLGATAALVGLSVPPGVSVTAKLRANITQAGQATSVRFSSPAKADVAVNANNASLSTSGAGDFAAGEFYVRTDTSRQIRARSSQANTTLNLTTAGWADSRGRFD